MRLIGGVGPLPHRKSLPSLKSQAEAWHTTSLPSLGFSIIELLQNSGVTGSRPRETKNSSDILNISRTVICKYQGCSEVNGRVGSGMGHGVGFHSRSGWLEWH